MEKDLISAERAALRDRINEDILGIIAKTSILECMTEGASRGDEKVGMALGEISHQLDKSVRGLLEVWELYMQYAEEPRRQQRDRERNREREHSM